MTGIIIVIIVLIAAGILFYMFFYHYVLDESDEVEEEKLYGKMRKKRTMVSRGPVISYKIPGVSKAEQQVTSFRTIIGQEGSDIVLKHNTVSKKHAELILSRKKNQRVFILKNLSKINPILQVELNDDGKVKSKTEILKDIVLKTEQDNYFKFGDVDVNIYFPPISKSKEPMQGLLDRKEKEETSHEKVKKRRGTRRMM